MNTITEQQIDHLFHKLDDIETVYKQEELARYQGDPIPTGTIWTFSVLYQLLYDLWDDTVRQQKEKERR